AAGQTCYRCSKPLRRAQERDPVAITWTEEDETRRLGAGSDDAARAQVGNGRLGIPQARQDLARVLAKLGGRPHGGRLRSGANVDGLTNNFDVAELRMLHRAGNAQVMDLRLCKRLIDAVDRSTGNARLIQHLDPIGARTLPRYGRQSSI